MSDLSSRNDEHALQSMLKREAWASERVINYLRAAVFIGAGLIELTERAARGGASHITPMPVVVLAWGILVGVLNVTVFRRTHGARVAALLTAGDVLVVTAAIAIVINHDIAAHPGPIGLQEARLEVARGRMGLLLVLVANMVRFSWRLTVVSAALVVSALAYLRALSGTLHNFSSTDGVMLVGFVALLVYTTRRFHGVLRRRNLELRTMQRQRVASLRGLVAGITHEFNSPLGALKGNADSTASVAKKVRPLLEEANAPTADRMLQALAAISEGNTTAVERLESVVSKLQRFANLDQAEVRPVALREILRSCEVVVAGRLSDKVQLRVSCDDAMVMGRAAELSQLFAHLLHNAFDAVDGDGHVEVVGAAVEAGSQVTVRDNGRGMPPRLVKTLMQPHFSTADGRAHLGLGLTAARAIADEHEGTLTIESQEGKGTVVTVTLQGIAD